MRTDLGGAYEEQLRNLAAKQGREIGALLIEAVRKYLETATITDLTPEDVAQTQFALMRELGSLPAWEGGKLGRR